MDANLAPNAATGARTNPDAEDFWSQAKDTLDQFDANTRRRVTELLEANNRYQQEARDARAASASLQRRYDILTQCYEGAIHRYEAAESAITEWQDISTAPRDGTFIITCASLYRPTISHWGRYFDLAKWGPDPETFAEEEHFREYWLTTSYDPDRWLPLSALENLRQPEPLPAAVKGATEAMHAALASAGGQAVNWQGRCRMLIDLIEHMNATGESAEGEDLDMVETFRADLASTNPTVAQEVAGA